MEHLHVSVETPVVARACERAGLSPRSSCKCSVPGVLALRRRHKSELCRRRAPLSDAFVSSLAKLLACLKNVRLAPRPGSRARRVADKPTSKRLHAPEQTASSTYGERLSAGPFHSAPSASRSSKFPSPAARLIPKIDFVSVWLRLLVSKEIVVPPPSQ